MESVLSLVLVLAILCVGIIFCFSGYRSLKWLVMLYAFVSGFLFTYNLVTDAFPETAANAGIIALVVGAVLALLSVLFIKFCIFLTGGLAGVLLYNALLRNTILFAGAYGWSSFLYGLTFFIIFGILALIMKKHLLIIFTSYIGAESITLAGGMLIGVIMNPNVLDGLKLAGAVGVLEKNSIFVHTAPAATVIPVIIFMIAGLIAQYKFTARRARY